MQEKHALLIEDDADLAAALTEVLEAEGFIVATAKTGDSGLRRAIATKPHLLCVDLTLPHLSGFDVCEGARRDPGLASCAIVIVSARDTPLVRSQALECGADGYVRKPIDRHGLLAEIARVLALRSGVSLSMTPPPHQELGWLGALGGFLRRA